MSANLRKKSPRAPSLSLQEAIERVLRIYEKERRHPAPVDVIAQDIGYKSANNGAAIQALASLRYYGLLDRPQDGVLAVVKDVEDYKFSPDEKLKRELIIKWLRTPPLFAELLDRYEGALPSDGNIKFDLIQRGFNPPSAEACVSIFRQSVDYVRYYENPISNSNAAEKNRADVGSANDAVKAVIDTQASQIEPLTEEAQIPVGQYDRIPVRLSNGRRAWLQIPSPFFAADKARLKAQIDLILTDDDEENANGADLL
jgi:hypothetical protein